MTDPFVQRMMARSQARRQNKENATMTDTTRGRLKQLNSRYSEIEDTTQPPLSPLRTSNTDLKSQLDSSPKKLKNQLDSSPKQLKNQLDSSPKMPESSPKKVATSPRKEPSYSSLQNSEAAKSSSRPRLNALAKRTQQMNNWEDDYSYHSTSHGPQVEVDGSKALASPSRHAHIRTQNLHAINRDTLDGSQISARKVGSRSSVKTNGSLSPAVLNSPNLESAIANTKPSYYFGDGPSVADSNKGGRSLAVSNNSNIPSHNVAPTTPSSASISSYSYNATQSPSKTEESRKRLCTSRAESPVSPTKRLDWDQSMLNSLEAQGFTPTESRSRLYFDFKKEQEASNNEMPHTPPVSPSKVKGMSLAEFMRNGGSPTKHTSPTKDITKSASKPFINQLSSAHANSGVTPPTPPPPPPVILTCHPKSPASSPVRTLSRIPSPEPKAKGRSRDTSPSKVGEMRSRWEQHIRDASPERVDRSRSPVKSRSGAHSPVKSFASQSGSHIRSASPVKSFDSQSGSHRSASPVKSFDSQSGSHRSASPVKSFDSQNGSHIRSTSPVKSFASQSGSHIRSASPVKSFASQSGSHIRSTSPVKSFASQSGSHIRSASPVKVCSPSKNESFSRQVSQEQAGLDRFGQDRKSLRDLSPVRDQERFSRQGSHRRSYRDLSPHKPPPVGDIVKGETPMPETVPLVEEPYMSSVKARAAAFNSAGVSRSPERDPAERSLQERRALFSKNQGTALVPKAPFGQSIPIKSLHADGLNGNRESSNKPFVAHSHPVSKPTKRIAVEPAPAFSQKLQQIQKGRSPSPTKDDEGSVGMQRMRFENVKDNWQGNEINNKIQNERQKEMEILLNRFKKPTSNSRTPTAAAPPVNAPRQPPVHCQPTYPIESETEYAESDESFAESTASEDTLIRSSISGPPKPPRLYLGSSSSGSSGVSPPPPPPPNFSDGSPILPARSPKARLNSTEIDEIRTSPKAKKEFVPKIKPGCLFPSLSDFESHSEAPDSQDEDDIQDSSFAESILTCASIESFGQTIKHMAQSTNQSSQALSSIAEQTEMSSGIGYSMSDSAMEAIDAIDNAIDEALNDEPTPPKRQRTHEHDPTSNVFKTPKINPGSPAQIHDDQNPLTHSISMYRKQKPEVTYTPVRQITRHPDLRSPTPEPQESPSVTVSARIRELQEEVAEQQRVISQASNAVTVVLQHIEHQGAPQHIEAEKLLLLATQKRTNALDEIQRLKTEGALAQHSWAVTEDSCRGSISISNISVPLKRDFIEKGMKGSEIYHLIVLVKHREQVISSQLLATPSCVVDGSVTFPNLMALHNLASDFIISLEVYALRTSQARNLTIKKEQSRMKLTPLKRLQKSESRMASPCIQSPGGPYAVRSSSFMLVGFTHLNIATLTRNAWTLEKVPFSSPLDGHLLMRVSCSFEGGITERGFLTMFEDIGGFGAWNRRWCVLNGMFLRYWRYPDDETKKDANGQIDLRSCTTRRVESVSRDVCARQHTFQLTCLRPAYGGDVSNLVQEVQGSSLVTRHLLSADSKEERIAWCNKLNKSLANIRAWDPDALRPEEIPSLDFTKNYEL